MDKKTYEIAVFEQNWNHARHIEKERLSFTNIYSAIVAAVLVFTRETIVTSPVSPYIVAVIAFILVLTLVGLIVATKLLL